MSMVSFLSCECSDQAEASVGIMFPRHARACPGHPRLPQCGRKARRGWPGHLAQKRASRCCPAMTASNAFPRFCTSPAKPSGNACFPALLAPNKDREIGGGRATRQPGQVRKEAALTRSGSGRSSVSYLFFERIARGGGKVRALRPISFLSASRRRETINCGSTDE